MQGCGDLVRLKGPTTDWVERLDPNFLVTKIDGGSI
jgi:hypothetical protein